MKKWAFDNAEEVIAMGPLEEEDDNRY